MTSRFLNTSSRHGPSVYNNVNEEKISPYHRGASVAALGTAIVGRLPLLLILLLAFTLRLLSARFLMGAIDSEGAEYARIAENLLNGNGYVGIAFPGVQLLFPPLFPWLIATVSLITHQSELAGRLISVIMGTLLVLPVYYIALRLYDREVASVAALLTACHPVLVGYASTVFSETTYMTFVLSGAYWSLRCLTSQTARTLVLAGVCFGLAYLTKPEAALYPLLTIFLLAFSSLVMNRRQTRQIVLSSFILLGAFLFLAMPYMLWLSMESGQLRWEGKTPYNVAALIPYTTGGNTDQALFGISNSLEAVGIANTPQLSVITNHKFVFADVLRVVMVNGPHNYRYLINAVSTSDFGSPILLGLVILGLFGQPKVAKSIMSQVYLLFVVLGVPFLSLALAYPMDTRYFLLFLPVMIIWAANGIVLLSGWASATMRLAGSEARIAKRAGLAVGLTSAALLIMIATYGVRTVWDLTTFDYNSRPVKQAGRWLDALAPGPKIIMDASTILAFHARASYIPFPYSDSSLALQYIEKKGINFIVLREEWLSPAPYIKDWLEDGVPDRRAQLIYSEKTQRGRILIYKWNGNAVGGGHVASEVG
jgi:4-amino-4-deoxy-L-arabinose transferase-like glycosyltransferase